MATEAILHQQRCQREPRVNVRWVRERIERPKGRSLKVLIYARFSKLGKRKKSRSNKAQRRFLQKTMEALKITGFA